MSRQRDGEEFAEQRVKKPRIEEPSRALYVGNLLPNTTLYDLCELACPHGQLEMVKLVPTSKGNYAFINFITLESAQGLVTAHQERPADILGKRPIINWAKGKPLQPQVAQAIEEGATRNLFVGSISPHASEADIAMAFGQFGALENVVLFRNKNIAFVNYANISFALKAKQSMNGQPIAGKPIVVKFAKDTVSKKRPNFNNGPSQRGPPPPRGHLIGNPMSQYPPPQLRGPPQSYGAPPQSYGAPPATNSRAVYCTFPSDIQYHDLCKWANRFGCIESIFKKESKRGFSAFVNFVDSETALACFSSSQGNNSIVGGHPVRVNWAKSTPIRSRMAAAIAEGATRNLYIGNLPATATKEQIEAMFAAYAPFDIVTHNVEKAIAFVNTCSIKSAMSGKAAMDGQLMEDKPLRVNYAKEGGRRGGRGPPQRQMAPQRNPQMAPQRNPLPYNNTNSNPYANIQEQQPNDYYSAPAPSSNPYAQSFFESEQNFGLGMGASQGQGSSYDSYGPTHYNNRTLGPSNSNPYAQPPSSGNKRGPIPAGRSIYMANLPPNATIHDVVQLTNQFGSLENVSIKADKHIAFINYIQSSSASAFMQTYQHNPATVQNTPVKIAWAKSTPLRQDISQAIVEGASRNLYIGNLPMGTTEEELLSLFQSHQHCYHAVVVPGKNIGFVHFSSIKGAMNALQQTTQFGLVIGESTLVVHYAKDVARANR